jgi:glycosyltransferase involved in cell wall biosynthesis
MVEEEGVGDAYKVLGMVPYADVTALMAHSLAVINPSLFEGWSTSVEEAKAMGKAIVLSRIPVHVEQDPARASFFDPHSVRELADALAKTHDELAGKSDHELMRLARERNRVAFGQFGELYQAAVMQTLSEWTARN